MAGMPLVADTAQVFLTELVLAIRLLTTNPTESCDSWLILIDGG